MAEWLVERGVGEDRALLVDGDSVLAARMRWPDEPYAGQSLTLTLTHKPGGSRRGLARDRSGREFSVDRLPPELTEGQDFAATVTRAALAERGRHKRPQARAGVIATDDVFAQGREVRAFASGLWDDVFALAASGELDFAAGSLLLSATPAMTLVDIDGTLAPGKLALAAVRPIAQALSWLDIGGSVGVDFPTLQAKADRKAVDEALGAALADWPHERTAMNGFGFVQAVARLEGPSLLHRLAFRRAEAAARYALRQAEQCQGVGATLLTIHPALEACLRPEWRAEVERRTARPLRIVIAPGLEQVAPAAQIVPL